MTLEGPDPYQFEDAAGQNYVGVRGDGGIGYDPKYEYRS